ncbi:MAG: hypothetical protein HC829_06310 [Bacteroidales bacterium]|nr:hypothetical protein [Bacteroidales bacterium]
MREYAVADNYYLVGGSHPTLRDGKLYNTAYLFTPKGEVFTTKRTVMVGSSTRMRGSASRAR